VSAVATTFLPSDLISIRIMSSDAPNKPASAKKKSPGLGLKIAATGRTVSDSQLDSTGQAGGLVPPPRPIELPRSNKLNVKVEDLDVMEELGAGNGGTVHRVVYKPTGAILARKVRPGALLSFWSWRPDSNAGIDCAGFCADNFGSGERPTAETDHEGTQNAARLRFAVHCQLLWLFLVGRRHFDRNGIHGLRVIIFYSGQYLKCSL